MNAELRNFTGNDGCGWIITLEEGTNLEPTNLAEFDIVLEEGKKVSIRYKQSKQGQSICMIGDVIDIECINER